MPVNHTRPGPDQLPDRDRHPACVFDLDATLSHVASVEGAFRIRGRTVDSCIAPGTLDRLARIARKADIFIATGRGETTVVDYRRHFAEAGVPVTGWILEHGAVVSERPEWTRTVLTGIDFDAVRDGIADLARELDLPVDCDRYRPDRTATILLSGKGRLLGEHLIGRAAGLLQGRFRTLVGRRKFTLIPSKGCKCGAFDANFGQTHFIAFAAGDHADDLPLLRSAAVPLATGDAAPVVRNYVNARGGFVADQKGHAGTIAVLDRILEHLEAGDFQSPLPSLRLPSEEAEYFRPSRRAYLDQLFHHAAPPSAVPDPDRMKQWAVQLEEGDGMVIEVRMRDWGGERKPLRAMLNALIPLLPRARWRLVFRPERLGVENLPHFDAVTGRLQDVRRLPDGGSRFSAPGVPGSPSDDREPPDVTICLYEHTDDLSPWYDHAISRLITRHPDLPRVWFANPVYLKIAGAAQMGTEKGDDSLIPLLGSRTMMAANVVDETDIRISAEGFRRLREADRIDSLIIAPRVVTNPERNRKIRDAMAAVGEMPVPLSERGSGDRSRVLLVDTYGDLPYLYRQCRVTYLGGGFDHRKRGFDPVESLVHRVPVVLGPIYDYNRIAVTGLAGTGWITVLADERSAEEKFVETARRLLSSGPDPADLDRFLAERERDSDRVAAELLADLAGVSGDGYLFPENRVFAGERISVADLLD